MIDSINYSLIPSEQLKTFGYRLYNIFAPLTKESQEHVLYPFILKHTDAYNMFSKSFEHEAKNPYTELLAVKHNERCTSFVGFRNYIVACQNRNIEGWNEAGNRIIEVIRKYGWSIPSLGYQAGTAAITGLIAELNNKCTAELALLAATEWVKELTVTQDGFEQTQNESVNRPDTDSLPLNETRPILISSIRSLLSMLDLQYSADSTNAQLANYVKAINELIAITMTTARANETRWENKKKKAETTQTDKQTDKAEETK